MADDAPRHLSPPWLRLLGLVLLAHALVLTALAPPVRLTAVAPPAPAWATRTVAAPAAAPEVQERARDAGADDGPPAAIATQKAHTRNSAPAHVAPSPAATKTKAGQPLRTPSPVARRVPAPSRAANAAPPSEAPPAAALGELSPASPLSASTDSPAGAAQPAPVSISASPARSPSNQTLPPVQIPPAATLDYAVTGTARGLPYTTQSQLRWQPEASRYQAEWVTQAGAAGAVARRWQSQGLVTATGLMPERFAEKTRSERAAHFDAAGQRIRFSANTPDAEWSAGGQDRLSAVLQLAGMLAAAPARYPPGSQIALQTAGARDAPTWVWQVLDDETLDIAGRPVPCAVLVHQPEAPYEPSTALWLARQFGHLPVRLRTTQANGDTLEHQLQSWPSAR